jgi:dCMP deaminase
MQRSPEFWRNYFMGMAYHVASASKDPSTKVGAVIVDDRNVVCGMGYNGFPRGVHDDPERYEHRPTKYKMVVHAEVNAVLNASTIVDGCTLYSTFHPCAGCAAVLIQSRIARVVCPKPDPRWADEAAIAATMFNEADVEIVLL